MTEPVPTPGPSSFCEDRQPHGRSQIFTERESGADDLAGWGALAELYHRFLTGLILGLVTRVGTAEATQVVFRVFRNQHLQAFLPGLAKLGLTEEPDAVACAKYHVLSNALGGVRVEWIPDSATKSWVRYLPPRWIFDGTAICAIPTEVARAMLHGWHGHNGVSLGNDRLGFVATKQTTDGQPGLEGYYIEEASPLAPEDRVRFRPGERPARDPEPLPLPEWDPVRLAKVERNYASNYIHSILPAMVEVLGPATARGVAVTVGHQIAMQYHQVVMAELAGGSAGSIPDGLAAPFADRLARLLSGHGPQARVEAGPGEQRTVSLDAWRLFDPGAVHPVVFECWNSLWEGLAMMESVRLVVGDRMDLGDPAFVWHIRAS